MKTNHRRGFVEDNYHPKYMKGYSSVAMDGSVISAWHTGGDACCGKRGHRRDRAGAKKFVHSRTRRKDRDIIRSIIKGTEEL